MNSSAADDGRLGERDIAEIANDVFLQSALETTIIRGATLEFYLTGLRAALLRLAHASLDDPGKVESRVVSLFCAMAQQCFLNEYVYAETDEETRLAARLREALMQKLSAGSAIDPLLLAAVGACFPLHTLPAAETLLAAEWPPSTADLLRQQVREPLEEAEDRHAIPALTSVDDEVSVQVMLQYEENPYPRWNVDPRAAAGYPHRTPDAARHEGGGFREESPARDILIAGCGTGEHPFDIAQRFPAARVLAIDLSRTSLAYARRKTREHGLKNLDYAQADILKLGSLGRTFDRIEAVGVLHHLSEPAAGWRVLLSLLAPDGIMRVGLYSEAARGSIVEARALIAERGWRATPENIRAFRQTLLRSGHELRWETIVSTVDFYSMSGCRDMLFNVMEHRFTIPEIAAFLKQQELSFLGFELEAATVEAFQQLYPAADALLDLDRWNAFEEAHPQTFRNMYQFAVRRSGAASR